MKFYPAKHNSIFIWFWQQLNFLELLTKVKLNINPSEIQALRSMTPQTSLILIANHSDELDPRVCMELSRRSGRRFTFMANSEIYKEWFGIARWCLQYIGSFSVERGAQDHQSIRYAIDTVKNGKEILVIFPEGEIYNLNDLVQPFKTGVAHIGLEALKEIQSSSTDKTVAVLPVAIKYRYQKNIGAILRNRIIKMEQHLSMRSSFAGMREELYRIMNKFTKIEVKEVDDLVEQLQKTRAEIISEIEKKYNDPLHAQGDLFSRAQKMIFFLREQINNNKFFTEETQKQFKADLKLLRNTIQMATWQPQYIELNPSQERLAETVLKLERVVFDKKRPPLFGKREVFVRLLEPLDLRPFLASSEGDAIPSILEKLRKRVQEGVLSID